MSKEYNVLLVDDEEKFLFSVSERIHIKGFNALTAQNGAEALEIARSHPIHAAVIDLKLPDMDGLALIEALKKLHPQAKCALLTGFGSEKSREAAEALDSAYFEKDQMGRFWNFIKFLRGKPYNVLVVDDEKKFLDMLSERIRIKGLEALTAETGAQALDLAQKFDIHAAVVDYKLPDSDGLELIARLKADHPDMETVLLTGYGSEKVQKAAEALDAAFFEKNRMGGFWEFIRRLPSKIENSMAAAGMAAGGDLEDAIQIEKDYQQKSDKDDSKK